jgi:glycosyltransferase involved in cell wall biosynthesis
MMAERKRVLIIDNLAVEAARRSLYRELAAKGEFEIHLLVPEAWRETTHIVKSEPESDAALHVHRTGILFGFRHHRVVYTRLFRILNQVRPDFLLAVHAPENFATLEILMARRLLSPGMKIGLFASRNIDLPKVGFPFKLPFLSSICDWTTSKMKVDVVYHRPEKYGHLYQRYTGRTVYIPHSVDGSAFKPDAAARNGMPEVLTIGYIGRLTEEKGVHLLLQALPKLMCQAKLLIVGEGPQKGRLQSLAGSLGLSDRVEFEPQIPYASMPQFINRLDALVLPSVETTLWKELFGRVLIEAMACEVPVVASDSGGIPEVLGATGILFRTGSVADLSETLNRVVSDRQRRLDSGRMGRRRVLEMFDTRVVAQTLAQDIAAMIGVRSLHLSIG